METSLGHVVMYLLTTTGASTSSASRFCLLLSCSVERHHVVKLLKRYHQTNLRLDSGHRRAGGGRHQASVSEV